MTCILAMNVISLSAQIVSEQAAKSKALNFFNSAKVTSNFSVRKAPRKAPKLETAQNRGEYYIFNDNSNGGYVIISGDERAPEVLGYSYTGTFNATTIPANMQFWLDGYAKQIKYLQTHKEAKAATQGMVTGDPIPPMLDSQWSQTDPYDLHCPIFYDDPSPTGCVATAMAQIMYYYQWPKQTTQVIPSYTTASWGIEVPAIDVTPIDWENMLPKYDGTVTEEQSNAIATLMYLCGAAAKMDYTPSESAANVEDAATAFETYFGYDSESLFYFEGAYDNCFPQKSWNQLMYEELQNKRPILYSGCDKNLADWAIIGDAHAFILDGYDKDDYFHVNWGWGGQYDGNFLLSALQPYSGKDYSYGYVAIMGIKPSTKSNAYAVFKDEMITFYCDTKAQEREGQLLSVNQGRQLLLSTEDIDDIREIRECVFDASFSKKKHSTFCPWLFSGRKNLREIKGLNNVDTQYTGSMIYMFNDCSSLTSLDVSGFKTDYVTNMNGMFSGCSSLTSLDVSGFKTDNVKDMSGMFSGCSSLTSLDVSGFKTDNVTDMGDMFGSSLGTNGCSSLTSLDVSSFKTENVTNMYGMFSGCSSLTSLDVSGFKTDNVKDMGLMFSNCSSLTNLDLSGFNTDRVWNMVEMFCDCSSLKNLDLSHFRMKKVKAERTNHMLNGCENLQSVILPESISLGFGFFFNCVNLRHVYCPAEDVPPTDPGAFRYWGWGKPIPDDATLYVPTNSVEAYRTTAPWSDFKNIVGLPRIKYIVDGEVYYAALHSEGDTIKPITEPTKEGYTFSGWSEIPKTMPAKDVTVTASFMVNSYKLTYRLYGPDDDPNGDGEEYKTIMIEYGTPLTLEADEPEKEGHYFNGWSEIPATMPAHDVVITGSFAVNSYTLTYEVDGKEYKTSSIAYGTELTAETEPTKEGYTFSGWSEIPATMPAHDVVVTGTFAVNSYALTYKVDGKEYKSSTVAFGTQLTPEAAPIREGYTFSGWSEIPEKMPAHDVEITGSFSVNKYTVTFKYGDVQLSTAIVNYGEEIPLPESLDSDRYTLVEWLDVPATMPAHDITIQASFTDGVKTIQKGQEKDDYYQLNGVKLDKLQKGLNIIRSTDGITRKVLRK